jgi:hypothetical protein
LKAFTKRAAGYARCSRSISDSLGPVKVRSTPCSGGSSVAGLVVSMISLPSACFFPTSSITDCAALPRTESTSASPQRPTSAKVPAVIPVSSEY